MISYGRRERDAEDARRSDCISYGSVNLSWCKLAESINSILGANGLPEDRFIGQFFLSEQELESVSRVNSAMVGKLFIYLWDDVLRHGLRQTVFDTQRLNSFNDVVVGFTNGDYIFSAELNAELGVTTQ